MVIDTIESVPIDADDLPGYAVRLFDRYRVHAEVQRLSAWYQLEKAGTQEPLPAALNATRDKIAAIRAAQKAGKITDSFTPELLLALILRMATIGIYGSPEASLRDEPPDKMRRALEEAVKKLVSRP
jgi:hypothetical protein